MLRHALSEVRLHPSRYISTLLAIAISVAFLVGAPVVVNTQATAAGRSMSAYLDRADAVVSEAPAEVTAGLPEVAGVAAASPLNRWGAVVRKPGGDYAMLSLLQTPPPALRWTELRAGAWPTAKDEVALTAGLADELATGVGKTLRTGDGTSLRVVGLLDQPDSTSLNGVLAPSFFAGQKSGDWIFAAARGVSPDTLAARLKSAVGTADGVEVSTGEQAREEAIKASTAGVDVFTYLLLAFAAVALVVGMITVANTFTITLAQRRRQIGLLRAVGASGAQLRARFAWEAALLGLVGSLGGVALGLGAAAIVAALLDSLAWGLTIQWLPVVAAAVVGVLATLAASWVPIMRSTRVAPLEALQPVVGGEQAHRASVVRGVVCGALVVLGIAAAILSLGAGSNAFYVAVASGGLLSLGVLFGAPLFVPPLLRAAGRTFRWAGPVARLAADNAERNPGRAATTASALMLAIGLMVTLQVGSASMKATSLAEIEDHFPVDVSVSWLTESGKPASVPEAEASRLAAVPGVAGTVRLAAAPAELDGGLVVTVIGYDPAIAAVTAEHPDVSDTVALVNPYELSEKVKTVRVTGSRGTVELTAVRSRLVTSGQLMVSAANLLRIGKPVPQSVLWLSVPDRGRAIPVAAEVEEIAGTSARVDGSILQASQLEQVLDLLLAITTGLLGIAVLIALIGVSNTLGLSVVERTRESALLRALGLQARSLRLMLMIEAIQVALVGVAIGILAGAFFGWLAVTSLGRSSGLGAVRFAVDIPTTVAMVLLAVLAAALASVLPGRRAAKAAPTQALADI